MKARVLMSACLPASLLVATCLSTRGAHARQTPQAQQAAPAKSNQSDQYSRITIEVSGGEKDTPVENASVYIKYIQEHTLKKDKKTEMNVKTNREGAAHVPEAPMGRALVQVVADGWKTYGRWYDINEPKQTIKVHLEKPPRWY
jgi:hypothetical protein